MSKFYKKVFPPFRVKNQKFMRLKPRIIQWVDQQLNITTGAIVTGVDFHENSYLYLIFRI